MTNDNLEKLLELTPKLPSMIRQSGKTYYEYDTPGGQTFGFGLYKNTRVAIQRVIMPVGAEFPPHSHDETEYIIVVSGRISLTYENERCIMKTGDAIIFKPNKPHGGKMEEPTEIISITIPAGEGYPDAE